MNALILKRLFVQSNSQELASEFRFGSGLNLITGDDNSVGKSTLVRLPLWALGCEFEFDKDWTAFDASVILTFEVGSIAYAVARHRDSVRLKEGDADWVSYEKITGDYARAFARIVKFGALLPRRKTTWVHEVPPPAFYFSAFYVDQRRGWTEPWNSFVLHQYEDWRRPVIAFHIGHLPASHFELGAEIARGYQTIVEDMQIIGKYSRAVEVLALFAPPEDLPETDVELDSAITDIRESMIAVKRREQRAIAVLRGKQEELEVTKVQRGIAAAAIEELRKDYDFAVTHIPGETLVCPLCATVHDNSLLSRAGILQDEEQASAQFIFLGERQSKIEAAIATTLRRLDTVRQELAKLNRKYKRLDRDVTVKSLLESMGTASIKRRADEATESANTRVRASKKTLRVKRDEQRELVDEDKVAAIDGYFRTELKMLCTELRIKPAFDIDSATPTDYRRLAASGGAADGSRLQLAYHLAIHRLIEHSHTEVLGPLILDTPNQQDQAALNYALVSKELKRRAGGKRQFFVCATRHPETSALEQDTTVIELREDRILTDKDYGRLEPMFSRVFGSN